MNIFYSFTMVFGRVSYKTNLERNTRTVVQVTGYVSNVAHEPFDMSLLLYGEKKTFRTLYVYT